MLRNLGTIRSLKVLDKVMADYPDAVFKSGHRSTSFGEIYWLAVDATGDMVTVDGRTASAYLRRND